MLVNLPLGLVIVAEAGLLQESDRGYWLIVTLGTFAFITAIQFVAAYKQYRAIKEEQAAGYTTLSGMLFDLWLLDDKTGEVLRRPGERELIADQLARRRRDGQASSSDDAVGSAAADALPPSGPGEDHRLDPPV